MPQLPMYVATALDHEYVIVSNTGRAKLAAGLWEELEATVDCTVRTAVDAAASWRPSPERKETHAWRNSWIMEFRTRPRVPVFAGCPMPKAKLGEEEKNARLLITYFHP